MADDTWHDVRSECERLDPGAELLTPVSERAFAVETATDDRIVVRFRDSDEERPLWREQFDVLADRLDDGPIAVADLPPGVEPYAAVLTLTDEHHSDGDELYRDPDEAAGGESPYLVSPEEARTPPRRVHDDALLTADLLERLDADNLGSIDTESLTDLYVMLSDVQHGADRLRRSVREPLLGRLGPDQELRGRYGTVHRTTREYRQPKDDEVILDALDERGIPREWVLGVDPDKLDVVLTVTGLSEDEVYETDEQVYVQKTGVDEGEKFSRLQGLLERTDELEGPAGEALREDIVDLEERIEEALSAD